MRGARTRAIVGLVFAGVVLGACVPPPTEPGRLGPPRTPRLEPLHAEPDPVGGGRIVDAKGREVLLRGVNVNAFVEYWQYGDFPTTFPLTEDDVEMIAGIGWNVVRLLVSWSRVEPEPGVYDDHYLREVRRAVRVFKRHGVYTIIDFHQDAWGASLAARPDEVCGAGTQPAFGWDGAPAWATHDDGAPRCVPAGIRELSPAVRAAFAAFWRDDPGPGGVGIRTRYTRMVGHVAERFAREEAVAGYDLMNEPNAFGADEVTALGDFYGDAVAEIRAAETGAGGFPHLVLFEPSITWSDFGVGVPPVFPYDENVVFAPHIYRGGLTSGPIPREDFVRARDDAARFGGAPMLVGEWGSSPGRAADPDDVYFRRHQALQDEFHFSSTLWTWRESCGDPHKAREVRAGQIPFVWGLFEVDCRTNTVVGPRTALVDQLRRAFVRAAPGSLAHNSFDPTNGMFGALGHEPTATVELLAWYPGIRADALLVSSIGLEEVRVRRAPDGGVFVTATTTGGWWGVAAMARE